MEGRGRDENMTLLKGSKPIGDLIIRYSKIREFADLKMDVEVKINNPELHKPGRNSCNVLICNCEWCPIRLIFLDKGMSLHCYHLLLASLFA